MNTSLFLEILSGVSLVPEIWCLILLGVYLSKESKRRGLRRLDWFKLPPSMNLILAVFIFNAGTDLRSASVWIWRRFEGSGQISYIIIVAFIVSSLLTIFGSLCTIRALTKPDHGDATWYAATAASAMMVMLLLLFR